MNNFLFAQVLLDVLSRHEGRFGLVVFILPFGNAVFAAMHTRQDLFLLAMQTTMAQQAVFLSFKKPTNASSASAGLRAGDARLPRLHFGSER